MVDATRLQKPRQCSNFRTITNGRPGAVSLVITQLIRMTVADRKGTIKRQHLAAMGWSRQTAALAITGRTDGVDHAESSPRKERTGGVEAE